MMNADGVGGVMEKSEQNLEKLLVRAETGRFQRFNSQRHSTEVNMIASRSFFLTVAIALGMALPLFAGEATQPVRMGCGIMTFDTVPGWGLGEDGKSVLGPTRLWYPTGTIPTP